MAALLALNHVSSPEHRDSIMALGLRPGQPADENGNYTFLPNQPRGVYLFSDGIDAGDVYGWDHTAFAEDLWSVGYFGPAIPDPMVNNAIVARVDEPIPATLAEPAPDY